MCASLARVSWTSKYSGNYISPETHAAERVSGHCAPHFSLSVSQLQLRGEMSQYDARHVCKINTRLCSILADWNLRSRCNACVRCLSIAAHAGYCVRRGGSQGKCSEATLCLSPIMRPARPPSLTWRTNPTKDAVCITKLPLSPYIASFKVRFNRDLQIHSYSSAPHTLWFHHTVRDCY